MADRATIENRVEKLRRLAAEGKGYEEISEALGVPYQNIYALARTHGVEVSRRSKTDRALPEIKALAAAGETIGAIAEKLNLSEASVRKVSTKHDIQITKPVAPVESRLSQGRMERLAEVERLFVKEGVSSAELARRFGVSREMIRQDLALMDISASEVNGAQKAKEAEIISKLAAEGLITSEIAERTGLNASGIRTTAKKFNITIPRLKAVEHGTFLSYQRGCTCQPCRDKNAEVAREAKKKRIEKGVPDSLHGTPTAYTNWDCRCQPCIEAGAAMNAASTFTPGPKERSHATWTPEEDAMVIDYNYTARELAELLDRSVGAVNARRGKFSSGESPE